MPCVAFDFVLGLDKIVQTCLSESAVTAAEWLMRHGGFFLVLSSIFQKAASWLVKDYFLHAQKLLLACSKAASCNAQIFSVMHTKKICSEADGFTADSCLYI